MYSLSDNIKETDVKSFINAGIQENVFFESVEFSPLKEGNDPVIRIFLKDEFGNELDSVLWPVDPERERQMAQDYPRTHRRDDIVNGYVKGEIITPDQAVDIASKKFLQRALHIAVQVVNEQVVRNTLKGAKDYKEFAEKFVSLFTEERMKNSPMRVKIVLDKKDYPILPYTTPFMESMSVPKEKSRLSINPKYDKITPSNAQQEATDDPLELTEDELGLDMDNDVF